jgi:hypothetical protein
MASTPARPKRYPSIIPAGPPPTMQQRVVMMRGDVGGCDMAVSIVVKAAILSYSAKNIKLFRAFRSSAIDISRPNPMFALDAARNRNAIS